MKDMRTARIYCAGVVLGLTLAAAVWLLTYRVWTVFEWIGPDGRAFHPPERVSVSPWWGAYATVAVVFIGVAISLSLLPEQPSVVKRLTDRFARPVRSSAHRRRVIS
jgi:hypothetical protein